MDLSPNRLCSAFVGHRRIAAGTLHFVAQDVKKQLGDDAQTAIIIDNSNSEVIEVDFRGDLATLAAQFVAEPATQSTEQDASTTEKRSRGRPKLGVVAKEVTLLPSHWEWLSQQTGGASVTLRKLVLQAKRQSEGANSQRQAQNATYRFMTTIAPGLAEYEEVLRALYADDSVKFANLIQGWPVDVKQHVKKLALGAFSVQNTSLENTSLRNKPDTKE